MEANVETMEVQHLASHRIQIEAKLHIVRTGTGPFFHGSIGGGNLEGALLGGEELTPWTEWIRRWPGGRLLL